MIIKKYCSRFETPRVQLSREAYENSGIEIFSSEKLPFAGRTSPEFARNLVKLLVSRVGKLEKSGRSFPDGIHIYELGAGTGILAKRILDLLKTNHKDIYRQIVLHASDISRPMITQLKNLSDFKEHQGRVSFEVMDALQPKFTHKPLLVYFTNLIDSLPCHRHLLVKDGRIFEYQFQSSLKKDAQIIDPTFYPPKVLEEKEIAGLLTSSDVERRLILAPQILTVLEEETETVPIADISNMGQEERKDIADRAASLTKGRPFAFTYNYPVRKALRKIIQALEEGGFILFSDFGVVSEGHEMVLPLEFGMVFAFPADFPGLKQVAERMGKACYLSSNLLPYPQEMLIDTFPKDGQAKSPFEKTSAPRTQEKVNDFLEDVKKILSEGRAVISQKSQKIARLYRSLPEEARTDYSLLNELAFLLLQIGFYQEAGFYADILLKNFGHAAGIYYYLVKGKSLQELGDPKGAEGFFKEAIASRKGFLAYAYLSELYWQQKRYREYIEVVKEYLKYTRGGDWLKSIFFIALAQENLFGHETALKTLKELTDLGLQLRKPSPQERELLGQAQAVLDAG